MIFRCITILATLLVAFCTATPAASASIDLVLPASGLPGEVIVDLTDLEDTGIVITGRQGRISIPLRGTKERPVEHPTMQGDLLINPLGDAYGQDVNVYNPIHDLPLGAPMPDLRHLNRVRAFFSSASGGFGMRIGYDRRVKEDLRITAGTELLTYGLLRSRDLLGSDLPPNVTRITLVSMPFGLQQQFATSKRVIPHVGFGAGPVIRFDHRPQAGFYPNTYGPSNRYGGRSGYPTAYGSQLNGLSVNTFLSDFPGMSLTAGGFVKSGVDIRVGSDKDLAITIGGRYSLTRFTDAIGNPGDFSGLSLAVGFGKYF